MDQHVIVDIGPGLVQVLMQLLTVIASVSAAWFAYRSHAIVKDQNGNLQSALNAVSNTRAASIVPPIDHTN